MLLTFLLDKNSRCLLIARASQYEIIPVEKAKGSVEIIQNIVFEINLVMF